MSGQLNPIGGRLDVKPSSCSIPRCPELPTTPLVDCVNALYWFCDAHADDLEARGYRPVVSTAQRELFS